MSTADKDNVTIRSEVQRELTWNEMDQNFQEVKNAITDLDDKIEQSDLDTYESTVNDKLEALRTRSRVPVAEFFDGDGTTTDFQLHDKYFDPDNLFVYLNGSLVDDPDYTFVDDQTVSFDTAPVASQDNVELVTLRPFDSFYASSNLAADLGSSDNGKGASLISYENGLTVERGRGLPQAETLFKLLNSPFLEIDGISIVCKRYMSSSSNSFGLLRWDSNGDKSKANGLSIIDPSSIGSYDGTLSTLVNFLTAQGNGIGVGTWVIEDLPSLKTSNIGIPKDSSEDLRPVLQKLCDIASFLNIPVVLDSGKISIKSKGTGYLNPLLVINSNQNLVFDEGSSIKISNIATSASYGILHIEDVDNVEIHNPKIVGDYAEEGVPTTPGGHGIRIYGSSNVRIYNPEVSQCRGDGIYIGVHGASPRTAPKNIYIENPWSHNNCRQGMSIVSSESTNIHDGIFESTQGTSPEAGIDIEPNQTEDPVNVRFTGTLVCRSNNGAGLKVDVNSEEATCLFDRVVLEGNLLADKQMLFQQRKNTTPNRSHLSVKELLCTGEGISFKGPSSGEPATIFIGRAILDGAITSMSQLCEVHSNVFVAEASHNKANTGVVSVEGATFLCDQAKIDNTYGNSTWAVGLYGDETSLVKIKEYVYQKGVGFNIAGDHSTINSTCLGGVCKSYSKGDYNKITLFMPSNPTNGNEALQVAGSGSNVEFLGGNDALAVRVTGDNNRIHGTFDNIPNSAVRITGDSNIVYASTFEDDTKITYTGSDNLVIGCVPTGINT